MDDDEPAEIPDTAPVMVLGGATLFPHSYMPLFLFEQRYRDMLSYCLERHRMFCIGHALPDIDTDLSEDPVHRISTIGLIRACVTHPDGTSHLMLSGLQRVEILGFEQHHPFRVATVLPLPSRVDDPDVAVEAALEVIDLSRKLCGEGKPMSNQLSDHLASVSDPAAIADVVSHAFLHDPGERQHLLETLDVSGRLRYLSDRLSLLLTKE